MSTLFRDTESNRCSETSGGSSSSNEGTVPAGGLLGPRDHPAATNGETETAHDGAEQRPLGRGRAACLVKKRAIPLP
jgi:hypothetical protein